ncbi:hypothetical protein [Aquibaculum arenosum]|uniref:Lipoprotein n=1 Tax=Aquibaculum arenosum TaxID=3032591 RepID=A0ABT5YIN6_9PROT|nr:hypothetical protein [Fodinicurvata sp. CAU 1616]MDF2094739.1 hypothetical protein [Fodinicurvata sp. CAU 1616]
MTPSDRPTFPFQAIAVRGALLAGLLFVAAGCLHSAPAPQVTGDPRDKVVAVYGQPHARQSNGNIEVWQYCEPASGADAARGDKLHLVWLIDGVVSRESHHRYDLEGCRNLYVVDLGSPPHRS